MLKDVITDIRTNDNKKKVQEFVQYYYCIKQIYNKSEYKNNTS